MNTAIYLLRAVQLGMSINDMESLEEGQIVDLFVESSNDSLTYNTLASQEDMDRF